MLILAWLLVHLSSHSPSSTPHTGQLAIRSAVLRDAGSAIHVSREAGDAYTYLAKGRRDPFTSLLGTGEPTPGGTRPAGIAGLTAAEISVRGILAGRDAVVAMVQGPDRKTYVVHVGERLLDGTVTAISPEGLTIVQDVKGRAGDAKRDIHKRIRPDEGDQP